MIERRRFIQGCTAHAAVLLVPTGMVRATELAGDDGGAPGGLSGDTFRSLVGEHFRCTDREGRSFTLELAAVRDGPRAPGLDQFSAVFRAGNARAATWPADLYGIRHGRTGPVLVRLEPSGQGPGHYIAQFGLFT